MFRSKSKTETPKKRRVLKVVATIATVATAAAGAFVFAKNRNAPR